MKKVLLIALVLGLVSTAVAQTSNTGGSGTNACKLKLSQAPAIRGIRLGMSVEQVLAQIPGSEADSNLLARLAQDHFGQKYVNVMPGGYVTSKEKFAGTSGLNLTFLDGRLLSFGVHYEGPEWNSREQFAERVAELLSLPGVGFWKARNQVFALACDGFEISVQTSGPKHSSILMTDTTVDIGKILREREEVPKEKTRRAFKP